MKIIRPQRPQETQGFPDHTLRNAALEHLMSFSGSWLFQEPRMFSFLQERSMHTHVYTRAHTHTVVCEQLLVPRLKNTWPQRKVRIIPATFAF